MNNVDQNNSLLGSLERDLNCSTEWKKVAIPKGLPALLEIFAKEVIRENPENIYEFLYNLAENLLAKREDEEGGQKRGRVNQDDESGTTKEKYNPFSEDLAAAKIQAGFRGYQTRKSLKNSKKGAEGDLEASSPSELLKTIDEWKKDGEEKDENENDANIGNDGKKGSVSFFTDADAKALLETIKEESVEVGSVSALASVPAETLNKISSSHMDAIPTADVLLLTDIEDEIMKIQIVQSQTDGADDENEQETSSEENKLQTDTEELPNTQAEAEDVVTELEEELAEIMCPGTSVNVTLPTTSTDDGQENSADQSQTDNDELENGETCEQETVITTEDQKKTETESETSQNNPDTDDVETQLENENTKANNDLEKDDESENINNEENVETPVDVDSVSKDISSPVEEKNSVDTSENVEQEEQVVDDEGDQVGKDEEINEDVKVTQHRDVAREANFLDDSDSESHQGNKNGELDTIVVEAEIHHENSVEEDRVNDEVTNQDGNDAKDDNIETAESAVAHEESIENPIDESLDTASTENSKEIGESEVDQNQEDSEKLESRPSSAKDSQDGETSETRPNSAKETQEGAEKSETRPNSAKETQADEDKSESRPSSAKKNQEDGEKSETRPNSAKENQENEEKLDSRPSSAKETQDEEKSESRPSSAKETQEDAEMTGSRPTTAKENHENEEKSASRPSAKETQEDAEKPESRPTSAKESQNEGKSDSRPSSAKEPQEDEEKLDSRPSSGKRTQEEEEKSVSRPSSAKETQEDAEKSESRPTSAKENQEDKEKSDSRPSSAKETQVDAEKSGSRPTSAKEDGKMESADSRPTSATNSNDDGNQSLSRPSSAKESPLGEKLESRPSSAKESLEGEKSESRPGSVKSIPEDQEGNEKSAKQKWKESFEKVNSITSAADGDDEDSLQGEKSESRPSFAKESLQNEEKLESRPMSSKENQEDGENESRPNSAKESQEDEKAESRPSSAKEEGKVDEQSESRPSSANKSQEGGQAPSRPSSGKEDQQNEDISESRPSSAAKSQDGDGKSESRPSSVKSIQEDNKNSGSRSNSAKENGESPSDKDHNENEEKEKSAKQKWKESFEKVNSILSVDDGDIQFIDEDTEVAKPSDDNQSDAPTNNCDDSQISNKLTTNESPKAASPVAESKEDTSAPATPQPTPVPVTPEPIIKADNPPVARARGSLNSPTPTETTPLVSAAKEPALDSPVQRRDPANRRSRVAASKYRSGFVMEDSMSLNDMEAEIEKEVLNEAATKIQAGFRGFQTRKSLHGLAAVSIENEDSSDGLKDPQANISADAESTPAETSETVAIDNAALPASAAEPNADALPENNVIVADASAEGVNLPASDEKAESEDIISDLPTKSDTPVSEVAESAEEASNTEATPVTETKEITRMPLAFLRSRSYPGSAEEDLPEEEEELTDDVEMVAIGKVGELVEGDENDNISVDLDLDEGYINNAATKIQANIRGFLVRKSLKRKGKGRKASQEESDDKTEGADDGGVEEDITDCNSNMDNVTNQETDDTTQVAATKIQAGFRGFKDRQKIRQKKQAAVTIQATVRGFLTRRRLAKARRKSLQRRRSSAKSISNDLQTLQKANLAATKIQSMYRGYQVRSKLNQNTRGSAHGGDE